MILILKHDIGVAIVAMTMGLCAAGLSAQSRHAFDLDVPAARVSSWTIEDIGQAKVLEAELEVAELRRDGRWRPAFTLSLAAGEQAFGLQMVQDEGERDLRVSLIVTEKGKVTGQRVIEGWLSFDGHLKSIFGDLTADLSGGEPCIARTRVPVWILEQARQLGASEAELLRSYPALRAEDLVSAWA